MKSSRRKSADPSSPDRPRALGRGILLTLGLLLGTALGVAFYSTGVWTWGEKTPSASELPKEKEKQSAELTGAKLVASTSVPNSPYKNTHPGVQYVGTKACVACHEEEHKSFMHTGMGRSMSEIDLAKEPPDGAFDHPASGCRYEVCRKDGQMWHRELLLTSGSEEVLLQEYPVKYACGSGRHSLTYLVEDDGFLVESPITWYASRQAWGMSPGYDRPNHNSFEGEVGESCLVCHAGQIKALNKSLHKMEITEATIGCEQCHGPGELHVQRQKRKEGSAVGEMDDTIVNPARLSRELSEAVCQQCHLRASATVLGKGKTVFDFRPGLRLSEYRQDYQLDSPNQQMTVVGHAEQMHQSRCYQESKTFSCLTCHGPHGEPEGKEALQAHYVQVCTSCHEPASCKVSPERRQKESPQNHCVVCHMPQTPTDIPHLAFTHHRVAIHDPAKKPDSKVAPSATAGVLRPVLDISHLGESEQKRSLGLAYLEVANEEENLSRRLQYQRQAMSLLTEVRAAGGVDGSVDAWLARLRFELGMPDVQRYAQSAMSDPQLAGMDLCNALFLIADSQFQQKQYHEAIQTLEPLNKLRRRSLQWLLLAQCQKELGSQEGTMQALEMAAHINPRLWKVHQQLTAMYRQQGDEQRARYHEVRAVPPAATQSQ